MIPITRQFLFISDVCTMANENGEGEDIPVAANVLGTIGTILWCIQLVPQIWYNWRRKKTEGLPASMMLLWATCTLTIFFHQLGIKC